MIMHPNALVQFWPWSCIRDAVLLQFSLAFDVPFDHLMCAGTASARKTGVLTHAVGLCIAFVHLKFPWPVFTWVRTA